MFSSQGGALPAVDSSLPKFNCSRSSTHVGECVNGARIDEVPTIGVHSFDCHPNRSFNRQRTCSTGQGWISTLVAKHSCAIETRALLNLSWVKWVSTSQMQVISLRKLCFQVGFQMKVLTLSTDAGSQLHH